MDFDPAKDADDLGKHGISLARTVDMDLRMAIEDDRHDDGAVRPISLRRAHKRSSNAMSGNSREPVTDIDNPEWTEADFRRAKSPEAALSPETLAQFGGTRGPMTPSGKVAVSLELNPEVVSHFEATGPGWQARIDETLKQSIAK
ncbi:BrnA antitoxin family protein [Aurantimonas sp. A2-1-M11]|uniref:BrnA antitoxin family protein n=1 Tax=Aurantimonas sp. A2-1-M11 TaxID=3113712 RepID=UPI002F92D05D